MAGGDDEIMQARLDEFLASVNEDVLDETLDTLLLDRYGSLPERLARLRRRINGTSEETDFANKIDETADLPEDRIDSIRAQRATAITEWLKQYKSPDSPISTEDDTNEHNLLLSNTNITHRKRPNTRTNTYNLSGQNFNIAAEIANANRQQPPNRGQAGTMIEVEIGRGQKLKIPEQIINYYASVPDDTQESELIDSVIFDQTVGLLENSRRGQTNTTIPIIQGNANAHRNRDTWEPRNQIEHTQQHWQRERDLSKIISAWKLTFTGNKSENIEEFLLRVKEHRKIAALSDAELLRAMPMLLQLPALNYYRNNEHKWKSWSQIEKALRERYRDEFYAERLEEKVKGRKQREDEPVFEYIAEMQAMYKKCPCPRRKINK